MDFKEFQDGILRTAKKQSLKDAICEYSMGLTGESGEVVEHLKKSVFHGHELDKSKVTEEMGDVLWYLTALATTLHISLEDVARNNMQKLQTRYPEGFRSEDSINRKV